jgi:hypothetical protein
VLPGACKHFVNYSINTVTLVDDKAEEFGNQELPIVNWPAMVPQKSRSCGVKMKNLLWNGLPQLWCSGESLTSGHYTYEVSQRCETGSVKTKNSQN